MGATASLEPKSATVFPGSEATCELRVRNTGSVVDEFRFQVLGDASPWTIVEPATLSLLPGDDGLVQVRFQPPRASEIPAGRVPFGVKVLSKEDPEASVVEEGIVDVGAFSDTFAELVPRTSRASWGATHDLAFDNRGNARVNATLTATDPDELLAFEVHPPALVADAGTATFAKIKIAPRKRFLRGPPQTRPFQVFVEPEGQAPTAVDGSMLQEPMVPRWVPRALLALLLLLLLLFILWLTLLKPTVKSAAKDAAREEQAAQAAKQAEQAGKQADKTPAAAEALQPGTPSPTPPAAAGGGGVTPAPVAVPRQALDGRLAIPNPTAYTVPAKKVLQLTDLVLQNPTGAAGTLRIRRDGTDLLVVALDNFRDLDYHFVAPLVFTAGQKLELIAQCAPSPPAPACSPGLYYVGTLVG